MNFIEIPSLSISSIVYPKIAERAGNEGVTGVGPLMKNRWPPFWGLSCRSSLSSRYFRKWVLTITAGARYADASMVLRVMAFAAVLSPFNIQMGSVLKS